MNRIAAKIATMCAIASLALVTVWAQGTGKTWTGQDATGQTVVVSDTSKIVAAGGAVTETIFALGEGARLVGVDISSLYPADQIAKIQKVGYIRQLSAEGVLSLGPKLILATEDIGPPPVVQQMRASKVPLFVIPSGNTVEGAKKRIEIIGSILGKEAEAKALVNGIEGKLKAVESYIAANRPAAPAKILFVYARGAGTLLASGSDTEADTMIKLVGAVNAVSGYKDYRPLTTEAAVAAKPDVILFMSGGLQSLGGIEGLKQIPALAATPALQNGRVIAMEDLYLLGFGPRLGDAALDLVKMVYPEKK